MALSEESSTVDLSSEKTTEKPDVNVATVLQGLQMTLAQLAKNSELQTEAIQNLKEDILLCSGDEGTEDTPAMDSGHSQQCARLERQQQNCRINR